MAQMIDPADPPPRRAHALEDLPRFVESTAVLHRYLGLPTYHHVFAPTVRPVFAVVDANMLLKMVSRKAQQPERMLTMEVAAAARLLMPVAPSCIRQELEDNYPDFKKKVSAADMRAAAALLLDRTVRVIEPPQITSRDIALLAARDAKDVPYAQLYEGLSADALWSRDADFSATSYFRIGMLEKDLLRLFAQYARFKLQDVGGGSAIVGGAVVAGAAAVSLFDVIRRAPPWVQIALLLAGCLAVGHPRSRAWLRTAGDELLEHTAPAVVAFLDGYFEGHREAARLSSEIESEVSAARRQLTTGQTAVRILAYEGQLDLETLDTRLAFEGKRSRAADRRPYLRKLLRQDSRVVELPDGSWSFRGWSPV